MRCRKAAPLMVLAAAYGAGAAGQYTLAAMALGAPVGLLGQSVGTVFYPRVTALVQARANVAAEIWRTTRGLAMVAAGPFLLLAVAGPALFALLFGEAWRTAGEYARWLSPWLFLQLVNKPAVAAIPALRLQGGLLVYEVASTGSKLLALWAGWKLALGDVGSVALFSLARQPGLPLVDQLGADACPAPLRSRRQCIRMKQVDHSHYAFHKYMSRARWASVWHQLDEVLRLAPASVLEIGPGTGVFKAAATAFGLQVQTLDPDPELKPDFVGSALALPLADAAVDLSCAFQVLEHLPYADSMKAFRRDGARGAPPCGDQPARRAAAVALPVPHPARGALGPVRAPPALHASGTPL
jgi:hypothetical protein